MIIDEEIVGIILDNAGVTWGNTVLDVACGTGVMIPYYLERGVTNIDAVDISPKMAEIAGKKFAGDNVNIICGDIEDIELCRKYDNIIIYNAFPHFPEPERLIAGLSRLIMPGGSLTVAHGMSREAIDRHHSGSAAEVSVGLMDERTLAEMFGKYLKVTSVISDERMYQVTGVRAI